MTIRDWPIGDAFKAASFSLSLDSSQSAARGFYTGNTQRIGHADRLRATITLPPTIAPAHGGQREAFMLWWKSSGGQVRIPMPHRKYPNGAMTGAPVLSASAAAGATSIAVSGARAGVNLLQSPGMELDVNGNGIADGWTLFTEGSVGTVSSTIAVGPLISGESGVGMQYQTSTALNGKVGIQQFVVPVTAGRTYTLSASLNTGGGASAVLNIGWNDSGGSYISNASAAFGFSAARRTLTATAPAGAAFASPGAWMEATSGAACAINIDNAQFEPGSVASAFTGFPTLVGGDYLSAGGNLLVVDYTGVTFNDAGAATVPLALPLQKAVSSGTSVLWQAPTGLWELDDAGMQLDYSAGNLQGGFAIPVRQVIA